MKRGLMDAKLAANGNAFVWAGLISIISCGQIHKPVGPGSTTERMNLNADSLRLTLAPRAQKGMLIRTPPPAVFRAFIDPAITTRFWFTRSSGKLALGAKVQWDWEMYGASTQVSVKEFEENKRIVIEWGAPSRTTIVEFRFIPWQGDTYVQITERGFSGNGDEILAHVADSTGGFALVLSAAKALLEHHIILPVVSDRLPRGLQL
jgi:uncharacterized protein YndB with AHSA1/START domain